MPWEQVLAEQSLTARFVHVREVLAASSGLPVDDVDPKVAVSAAQVALASRLWSVTLASAVLHQHVPDVSPANLVASPAHRGPVPLGLSDPQRWYAAGSLDQAVTAIDGLVVRGSLAALNHACGRIGRTPQRVLASNATSSLVGAARVLARLRPDAGPRAWALARALLALDGVAQGGGLRDPGTLPEGVGGATERAGEVFLRSGCCVFYRLPGHGLCPDCVLAQHHAERVTPAH
ncbi:(2Fe-2S)-binding protein [Ornithinimicrobium pratense]|uniref:(2Fe-2S)-binding protein n=1 Tax=Ornithinimicrobium pratense TaxID=2593973 RepID=A0A5J6V4U4_9MICO|nr:(2Fe-2S)-binding protein [Ornithinimicrobium pratense]QFG68033.1 (2Fe-2S)-binding protein [Ornithinimicrobium pratense]